MARSTVSVASWALPADDAATKTVKSKSLSLVPGTSLKPLADMNLTWLEIARLPVSDLTPLRNMRFKKLQIGETQVSDLTPLTDMPLTWLNFGNTPISDLTPLKNMQLTYLHCNGPEVTDAGLEHLTELRSLTHLTLRRTGGTAKGIAKLKAALPNCKITAVSK